MCNKVMGKLLICDAEETKRDVIQECDKKYGGEREEAKQQCGMRRVGNSLQCGSWNMVGNDWQLWVMQIVNRGVD